MSLPALVIDPEVAEQIAQLSGDDETMRSALGAVAAGIPPLDAADACGCTDLATLWRHVESLGLVSLDSDALVTGHRTNAVIATQLINKKLLDPDADHKLKDLAVVSGIATDKVRDYERWRTESREMDRPDRLDRLFDLIEKGRVPTELSVKEGSWESRASQRKVLDG